MTQIQIDKPAPDFNLPDFNGQIIRLSDFSDRKKVLLVFNRGFF
jgi:peroxiredoxin